MNPDELVDVIDENGATVKTITKQEAHVEGALHKCVIGEIITNDGRWLLVKQSSSRQDAGQYVSPIGGHVTSGETEEESLKREADEECGLKEVAYEFVGRAIFDRHVIGRHKNHMFVMFKVFSDAEPELNHEADSYQYFTKEELRTALKETPGMFGAAFHFVIDQFFPNLIS